MIPEKKKVLQKIKCKDEKPINAGMYDTNLGELLYMNGMKYFTDFNGVNIPQQPTWWLKEESLYTYTPGELKELLRKTYREGSENNYFVGSITFQEGEEEYIKSLNIK